MNYATPHDDILDDPALQRAMLEKLEADGSNGCPASAFSHWWIQIGSRIIDPVPGEQNEHCEWWSAVAAMAWQQCIDRIPGDPIKLYSWDEFKAAANLIPQSYHKKVRWCCWRMYLRAAAIAEGESWWENDGEDAWPHLSRAGEGLTGALEMLSLMAWKSGYKSGDAYALTMWAKWWSDRQGKLDLDAPDLHEGVAVHAFAAGMELKWTGGAK